MNRIFRMQLDIKITITFLFVTMIFTLTGCQSNNKNLYTGFVEDDTNDITAYQSGKIIEILANEGDSVEAGDVIAKIDSQTVELNISKVTSQIESQRLAYDLLKDAIDDRDLQIAQKKIENLDGQIALAKDTQNQAAVDLDRANRLYETGAIAKSEIEKYSLALEQAKTEINTLIKERSQLFLSYETLNEGTDLRSLEQINLSIAQLQDDLELLNISLEDCNIKAPISGRIETLSIDLQDFCTMGLSIGKIYAQKPYVIFYVENTKLSNIQSGDEVSVWQDGLDTTFKGNIYYIADQAQFTPKNVTLKEDRQQLVHEVKAWLPVSDGFLPGMMVDVSFNEE